MAWVYSRESENGKQEFVVDYFTPVLNFLSSSPLVHLGGYSVPLEYVINFFLSYSDYHLRKGRIARIQAIQGFQKKRARMPIYRQRVCLDIDILTRMEILI